MGYQCGEDDEGGPHHCPADCGTACGNGTCDRGESPVTCAEDCKHQVCGNAVCEPADGGPEACPQDCGSFCGNCECEPEQGETFLECPIDCGFCGDGLCSGCPKLNERPETCTADCCTVAEGGEVCNGEDDDCDGETDEDTVGPGHHCDDGDPCTADTCSANVG